MEQSSPVTLGQRWRGLGWEMGWTDRQSWLPEALSGRNKAQRGRDPWRKRTGGVGGLGTGRTGQWIREQRTWGGVRGGRRHFHLEVQPGLSGGSVVKNLPVNAGDARVDPWVGKIPWRRKWQPTPGFLPVKSHGQRSLAGCSPQGHRESDTAEHACRRSRKPGGALGPKEGAVGSQ